MELLLILIGLVIIGAFITDVISSHREAKINKKLSDSEVINNYNRIHGTNFYNRPTTSSTDIIHSSPNDEDFLTSMVVAEMTNNAALGYMAGGSITGAVVGESLSSTDNQDTSSDDCSSSCSNDSNDSSSSSNDSCSCDSSSSSDDSSSSYDSSSDSSGSFDSGSND